ncbi:MAG: hypothetical protein H6R10_2298 [Rhodocyclaceae bacterium]|nr:hypothetical protein [Rhodocyclaceae bacterium]
MKVKQIIGCLALTIGALLSAASLAEEGQSGFLGDYSALTKTTDAAGDTVMRYVNPNLKPGAYQQVMIDPTQYYPVPAPTKQVSADTLEEIRNYVDRGLREKLGTKVTLASQPGPGVLRIRPAITAVVPQTPGLKPYQVLPIAFVVTAAKGRGKEAAINMEVEAVDSVTGERMGASMRRGVGAKLANDKAPLTLRDVQPLLDRWIDTGASFIASQVK